MKTTPPPNPGSTKTDDTPKHANGKGHYGAAPRDWDDAVRLGLLEDLLPVVSNPAAVISPHSGLTTLGKVPSIYNRQRHVIGVPKWTERKTTSEHVRAWSREHDYGMCIQTRRLRALDIDIKDAALSGAVVAAIGQQLGLPEIPRRYRAGTGKCLVVFWLLADERGDFYKRSFKVSSGEVVEFLATGEQYVAVATHPSGSRYLNGDLDCLPDAAEIPTLTRDQFGDLWASLVAQFSMPDSASKRNGSTRLELVKSAIHNDPIAQKFIEAKLVRGNRPDCGLNVHCPWESEHSGDSGKTETTYWPPYTGGLQHGGFACKHEHCAKRTVADVRKFFGLTHSNESSESKRFELLTVDELLALPHPTWLIKGVLPRAALIVVYGEAGSGKSAFAYDMAVSLVNGTEWCRRRVVACRVVWIAAEGSGGHRNRTQALEKAHGLHRSRLLTLLVAPDLLKAEQVTELATTINAHGGADVIAVDTVAQVTPGANENSSEHMGLLIANCRTLHDLTGGATIMLIHHAGKDATKGPRGWSGLHAAVDAEIEITRTGSDRVARISKMKDGDDNAKFPFTLRGIIIGIDDDGDEITAVVVEHSRGPVIVTAPQPTGAHQKAVYRALTELQSGAVAGRVGVAAVIDRALPYMVRDTNKPDRRRYMAERALKDLVKRGAVHVEDDYVWSA